MRLLLLVVGSFLLTIDLFLLTVVLGSLFAYGWSFCYIWSFSLTIDAFSLAVGKCLY